MEETGTKRSPFSSPRPRQSYDSPPIVNDTAAEVNETSLAVEQAVPTSGVAEAPAAVSDVVEHTVDAVGGAVTAAPFTDASTVSTQDAAMQSVGAQDAVVRTASTQDAAMQPADTQGVVAQSAAAASAASTAHSGTSLELVRVSSPDADSFARLEKAVIDNMPSDMLRRLSADASAMYPTSVFLGSYDLSEIIASLPLLQDIVNAQLEAWIVTVTPESDNQLSNARSVQLPAYVAPAMQEQSEAAEGVESALQTQRAADEIISDTAVAPQYEQAQSALGSDTSLFDELLSDGFAHDAVPRPHQNESVHSTFDASHVAEQDANETPKFESYYDDSLPSDMSQVFFAPDELSDVRIDVGQLQDFIIPPLSSLNAADTLSKSVSASFVAPRQDEILAGLPAIRSDDEGFVDESTAAKYIDYYAALTDLSDKYAHSVAVIESLSEDEYIELQSQVSGIFEKISPAKFDATMSVRSQIAGEASSLYRGAEMIRSQYHENMASAARAAAIAAAREYAMQNFDVYTTVFDEMLGDSSAYIAKLANTNAAQSLELIVLAKRALSSQDAVDELLGKGIAHDLVSAYMNTLQYRVLVDRKTSELIGSFSDEVDAQNALIAHKSAYSSIADVESGQPVADAQPVVDMTDETIHYDVEETHQSPSVAATNSVAQGFDGAAFLAEAAAQRESAEAEELENLKAEVAAGATAAVGTAMEAQPQPQPQPQPQSQSQSQPQVMTADDEFAPSVEEAFTDSASPAEAPAMSTPEYTQAYDIGDTGPSEPVTEVLTPLSDTPFIPDASSLGSVINGDAVTPAAAAPDVTAQLSAVGDPSLEEAEFDESAALAELTGQNTPSVGADAGELESLLDSEPRDIMDDVPAAEKKKRKVPLPAKIGLSVGAVMLAGALGLGALTAATSTSDESAGQPSSSQTESQYTPEQLEKIAKLKELFREGDVLNITANGANFKVQIAETRDDGVLAVDSDNEQYIITWPQLDAYAMAHPDEFPDYDSSSSSSSNESSQDASDDAASTDTVSQDAAGDETETATPESADESSQSPIDRVKADTKDAPDVETDTANSTTEGVEVSEGAQLAGPSDAANAAAPDGPTANTGGAVSE